MLELVDRPAKPLCGVEKFIPGTYVKWNNNWDWAEEVATCRIYIYVYICICIYIYIYMYVCMYIKTFPSWYRTSGRQASVKHESRKEEHE